MYQTINGCRIKMRTANKLNFNNYKMKIIQTWYKGIKFRSRTEARWCVFFDALNIEWEYEVEGYVLKDGTCYLPDFYLPTFEGGMYVEVKGKFTQQEKELCRDFCYESGHKVLLAEGIPKLKEYIFLVKDTKLDGIVYFTGLPNANRAEFEDRMFAETGLADFMTQEIRPENADQLSLEYLKAISKARNARFEYGEKGGQN